MSYAFRQPSLFYHLRVRDSFSMANNIILYCDTNSGSLRSLKKIVCQKNTVCTRNYIFIPYMVTPHNKVYCCDSSFMKGLTELMQPNFELLLGTICLPLVDHFVHLLKVAQVSYSQYFWESVLNDIRKTRNHCHVKFLYTFELNRRNLPGDKAKTLDIMITRVQSEEQVASDMYCLFGRICKDMFWDSNFTDTESSERPWSILTESLNEFGAC